MSEKNVSDEPQSSTLVVKGVGLAYGGECVSVVVPHEENPPSLIGKKVFVRGLIPEEIGVVSSDNDRKSYAEASLLRVLSQGDARQSPPCKFATYCGGCDYQHIAPSFQRTLKRAMVENALQVQGKLSLPASGVELLGSDLPAYGYRRRSTFHLDELGRIGFFAKKTSTVVAIDECHLSTTPLNSALKKIIPLGKILAPYVSAVSIQEFQGDVLIGFRLHEGQPLAKVPVALIFEHLRTFSLLQDHEVVAHYNDGVKVAIPPPTAAFCQVNEEGNAVLISCVLDEIGAGRNVTEFYAGSGNFTIPLAKKGMHVTAIELDKRLTDHGARVAADEQVLQRITFHNCSSEKYIKKNALDGTILLDPPRSGAKAVCEAIDPHRTKHLVYVSCNLPSLVRDLGILVAKNFKLKRVAVIDMFSQTHHVEVVAVLSQ